MTDPKQPATDPAAEGRDALRYKGSPLLASARWPPRVGRTPAGVIRCRSRI